MLIPTAQAGCSLADTIDADQLRNWKAEHPGAAVVAYVNTSAAVKAEADVVLHVVERCGGRGGVDPGRTSRSCSCPTSSSATTCDGRPGATTSTCGWVNATSTPGSVRPICGLRWRPIRTAEVLVHPECGCASSAIWLAGVGDLPADRTRILSTSGMLGAARDMTARTALIATEIGMLHQLRKVNQRSDFPAGEPEGLVPLHEDDHARDCCCGASARAATRSRCPRRGRPCPGSRGDDRGRDTVSSRRMMTPDVRGLPALTPTWEREADVVVVGAGAAGLSAALAAATGGRRVLLLLQGDSSGRERLPWPRAGSPPCLIRTTRSTSTCNRHARCRCRTRGP